jgi:C-terminal processing protease CtpA/Prc
MYPNVKTPASPSSSTSSSGTDGQFENEMAVQVENNTTPFHRVVLAPSGRIGVTFVEYRGHCMVSEVAANSPLEGWIFPSDVLIAIDELAVSGMRVRDIIKILKERTERQRALRVISSHAMNEFALQTSTLNDTSRIDE